MRRPGCGSDGSSAVGVHTHRHGVAEGLPEAFWGRSTALHGERSHWSGAGCIRVKTPEHKLFFSIIWQTYVFFPLCLPPVLCFCRPEVLGRIIGNLVLTNKKAQFVITHKLLLLQYKHEVSKFTELLKWCWLPIKWVGFVLKVTPFVFTDCGPENYSGLPCSRPGTKAPSGPGRFCLMTSSKITTYSIMHT